MISRSQIDNSGGALPPESLEKVSPGHREERAKVGPGASVTPLLASPRGIPCLGFSVTL